MPACIPPSTPVCSRVEFLYTLATEGARSSTVKQIAELVLSRSPRKTLQEFIDQALIDVQRLPHVPDPAGIDCYKTAEETARSGAECKGKNVLFCAIMLYLGIHAEPVWIMQPGMPLNHVCSVVWLEGKPYWADASIPGAHFGESSYEALRRTGAYHIVGGSPVLEAL